VPAWLVIRFGDEAPPAMVVLAGVAFVVGIPALFALLRWVPEPTRRERRVTAGWRDLIDLLRVGDCRRMLICWLLNGIANGLPAVLFPLVVSDFLQLGETQFYFLLVVYFASAIAVTPAWLVIARRRGKSAAWSLAIAVNMVVFAQVLWLGPQSASWFFAICLLSGATLGADLALPPSIQADIMESDRVKSGLQRTATGFALWSMATKLALAIAVALAFVVGGMGPSGSSVVIGSGRLLSLYVIVPVLLKGAVYVLLRRGSLSVDLESMTQRPQAAAK
jgi:GPH family glycoside/pentoside/hexuronide:cation symporter